MKLVTKLYLRTFLFTGIPYGLMMIGFDLLDGEELKPWKYLFLTFFFGITMSFTLVSFHKHRLKKNGIQEMTDENFGVIQSKNLKSDKNKSELIQELKADPIIGKMKMTEIKNGILLKTGVSWKSWGEEIKITQKSNREREFEYQILSSPKLKLTLVDYGKNFENINLIENVIKNIV